MRFSLLSYIVIFLHMTYKSNAQDNTPLCTKGVTYGELISFFQMPTSEKLVNTFQQKCFEEFDEGHLIGFKTYERKYSKVEYNTTTDYNELLITRYGKAYEYRCSEFELCTKLLKQINDNAIYYCQSLLDTNAYIYILKDRIHAIEMRDIPDANIGYAYGFKYRNITTSDLKRYKDAKVVDDFPKSAIERLRLEYRYERIDSFNNPTTIYLNIGDKVYMEAGGEVTLGTFAGNGEPPGIDGYTSYNRIEGFKHGSLLFRVGNKNWDSVNYEKIFTVSENGNLQFIINDNDPSNNNGYFWINIKIIRSK